MSTNNNRDLWCILIHIQWSISPCRLSHIRPRTWCSTPPSPQCHRWFPRHCNPPPLSRCTPRPPPCHSFPPGRSHSGGRWQCCTPRPGYQSKPPRGQCGTAAGAPPSRPPPAQWCSPAPPQSEQHRHEGNEGRRPNFCHTISFHLHYLVNRTKSLTQILQHIEGLDRVISSHNDTQL